VFFVVTERRMNTSRVPLSASKHFKGSLRAACCQPSLQLVDWCSQLSLLTAYAWTAELTERIDGVERYVKSRNKIKHKENQRRRKIVDCGKPEQGPYSSSLNIDGGGGLRAILTMISQSGFGTHGRAALLTETGKRWPAVIGAVKDLPVSIVSPAALHKIPGLVKDLNLEFPVFVT